MDEGQLKKAFRNVWLLVAIGLLYTALYLCLALWTGRHTPEPAWDMDGEPFVPASSPYADGYPVPPEAPQR